MSTALDHSPRIVVTGSLAFDHIMDFPGNFKDHIIPDKMHVINLSFLVGELRKQRGGCAANIAYNLALLGTPSAIVASAGGDFESYARWLETRGIDTSRIAQYPEEITASCFITTDRANNQITGFFPGAMRRASELSLAELAPAGAELVIISPDDPQAMIRHCREAKGMGIKVVFDPSFQVIAMDGPTLSEATRGTAAVVVNDYELAVLMEKTGLDQPGLLTLTEMLIVTYGERGSEILRPGCETIVVPAASVAAVVDPTGAGDAFRAGFLAGWLRGFDLATCGRLGSLAGAWAVENYGTQSHDYDFATFAARYTTTFGAPPPALS